MQKLTRALGVAGLVMSLALGASAAAQAADRPDSWVTLKTKLALMTTEGVDTWDLNVDTTQGAVTLHGKVATEEARKKAETVASGIEGAKSVKNLLQVVAKSDREVVEKSDDAIKDSVEAAFKANARVKDSGIKVAPVNKGVVLLSGKTKSLEAHLEAVKVADAVKGVHRVSTEVVVEQTS